MTTSEYCVDYDVVNAAVTAIEEQLLQLGYHMAEHTWCDTWNDISSIVEKIQVLEDK